MSTYVHAIPRTERVRAYTRLCYRINDIAYPVDCYMIYDVDYQLSHQMEEETSFLTLSYVPL
jgi:hypothetical protein